MNHNTQPFTYPDLLSGVVDAPPRLAMEMAGLIRFNTSTLTAIGFQRNGVWGEETASQKVEAYIVRHRGVLLGSAKDPVTLFVKTVKTTNLDAAYGVNRPSEGKSTVHAASKDRFGNSGCGCFRTCVWPNAEIEGGTHIRRDVKCA